jgi:hypothetical protein
VIFIVNWIDRAAAKPLTPEPLPLVPVTYPKLALLRSVVGLLKNGVFVKL